LEGYPSYRKAILERLNQQFKELDVNNKDEKEQEEQREEEQRGLVETTQEERNITTDKLQSNAHTMQEINQTINK
jgi:hypothetical protein